MPLPPRHTPRHTRHDLARKPLLGFGWTGALCLVPLIALLLVAVTGYDLRYRIQELICEHLGVPALFDFTIWWIVASGMAYGAHTPAPWFGPAAMAITLVALHLHPRRTPTPGLLLILFAGLVAPVLSVWFSWRPLLPFLTVRLPFEVSISLVWLSATLALWVATRSRRLTLLAAICLAIPTVLLWITWLTRGSPMWLTGALNPVQPAYALAMHAAFAAILLTWAIQARRRVVAVNACTTCGYDLSGLPTPLCPECGLTSDIPTPPTPQQNPSIPPEPHAHTSRPR